MSSTFEKHGQSASRQFLAPFLLAIFFVWQVAYHFFMHKNIGNDDAGFDDDSDEACLFKGWNDIAADFPAELPDESPAELESLLTVTEGTEVTSSTAAPADSLRGLRGEAKPRIAEPSKDAMEGLMWDLAWNLGGGDASRSAPEKTSQPSSFMAKKSPAKQDKKFNAQELTEFQKKVDAKLHLQAQRHAEHRAMRALHGMTRGTTSTTTHLTPWAENLMHELHDMQEHLEHLHERREHAAAFASAYNVSDNGKREEQDLMTPWAHKLDDLTHDMQHHMEQRKKERAEHEAARKAAHAAHVAAARSSPLLQEIDSLRAELCKDPKHRDYPSCSQFALAGLNVDDSKSDSVHKNAEAHTKLLEKHMEQLRKDQEHEDQDIRHQSEGFLRELCADPARKSYPACVPFSTTSPPVRPSSNLRASSTTPAVQEAKVGHPATLQWARLTNEEVAARSMKSHHAGASPLSMDRKELRGRHWVGKIPHVACVSVLPQGKVTEALMQYFMDNYKLQQYEGTRELILVYHSTDREAKRIAHLHADGAIVKAAAAQGNEAFPSATAYRYGAWLAKDADLVARWDFEGFHHPNRLSMQVHAIALSKRPVSLLPSVTAFDADGKHSVVSNAGSHHGSLIGDKAWMRKHWRPVLEEEEALLHGLHSGDVTQVAMPELLSYHDASMLDGTFVR